jgi:hypothetical protein
MQYLHKPRLYTFYAPLTFRASSNSLAAASANLLNRRDFITWIAGFERVQPFDDSAFPLCVFGL